MDRLNIHLYMNTGPLLTLACALALARPQPRPRQYPPHLRRDLLHAVGQSPTIQYIMPLLPTPATPLQHSVLALGQTKRRWNRCKPHVVHSQDPRSVGICSTNCSDVRRQFRKLGCLRLEIIPESEPFRLFRRFITDYDSMLMRNSVAYVARVRRFGNRDGNS